MGKSGTVKLMPQKGFAHIFIVIALVAVGLIIFLFIKNGFSPNSHIGNSPRSAGGAGGKPDFKQTVGPNCPSGPVFTKIPLDPDKILSVTPLGNLNPPDHTIPTDHIYLVLKENNEIHPEASQKVIAPSNVTISTITHTTAKKSGKVFSDDYSIDFSPCKDIQAKFGHVTKLSPKLFSLVEKNKGDCKTQHPRPEDEYTYCNIELNEKIPAGEELGEAGGGTPTGLDFWAIDLRAKELVYANPKRYNSHQLHTVCPLDLFEPSQKAILSSKFGKYEKKRTIEPLCGQINQDIAGTAQGNWTTAEGYIDKPEAWSKSLALVHDNVDPTIGIVSIGGTIGSPTKIQFTPTSSGNINRDFNQVKDQQIYCYGGQSVGINSKQSGRVLIQLEDQSKLKVEYQNGTCQDNFQFTSPATYNR